MRTITNRIDSLRQQREGDILKLLQEGVTYQRCAEAVGVSITTVVTVARKHGIRRKEQEPTATINPTRPNRQKE
jgi:uncharacterized protein YerC